MLIFFFYYFRISYLLGGGLSPAWFHIPNIILHGIVSVLLLLVFSILFGGYEVDPDSEKVRFKAAKSAFLCALLFAVHPIHTESVSTWAKKSLVAGYLTNSNILEPTQTLKPSICDIKAYFWTFKVFLHFFHPKKFNKKVCLCPKLTLKYLICNQKQGIFSFF